MAEPVIAGQQPVDNQGVLAPIKALGNYLSSLTNAIFGGAAEVTRSGVNYALQTKRSIDPIVSAVGETAKAASDLTMLGALLDRSERTPFRAIYEQSKRTQMLTEAFETTKGPAIEVAVNSALMDRSNIKNRLLDTARLPLRKADMIDESRPNLVRKKKKKKWSRTAGYQPVVKKSRRRK
jgi:hypothetical protein